MSLANQAHFGNYAPWTFGWDQRDPMSDYSLLANYSHSGVQFAGGVHVDFVNQLTGFLNELVPLIPSHRLVAGVTGCYNPGSVTVNGARSFHTYAIACDLNWSANPMGPADRPTAYDSLPAVTGMIANRWGMEWGGDWSYPKDWMHVETHLSPADARAVAHEAALTAVNAKPIVPERSFDMYEILKVIDGPSKNACYRWDSRGLTSIRTPEELREQLTGKGCLNTNGQPTRITRARYDQIKRVAVRLPVK
jgi:hypothetical protein